MTNSNESSKKRGACVYCGKKCQGMKSGFCSLECCEKFLKESDDSNANN